MNLRGTQIEENYFVSREACVQKLKEVLRRHWKLNKNSFDAEADSPK